MSLRALGLLFVMVLALLCAAIVTIIVVLSSTPKLNSSEQDDLQLSQSIREDHERLNFQIGKQAFRKLEMKYGCDASQECSW
jgi:hypothetical protein